MKKTAKQRIFARTHAPNKPWLEHLAKPPKRTLLWIFNL